MGHTLAFWRCFGQRMPPRMAMGTKYSSSLLGMAFSSRTCAGHAVPIAHLGL